jgi:ubiquinone/menaquinone biosynthesis C-methylase UbiE
VLDIGAGTGLVAAALGDLEIDALDLSRDMLEVAGAKGLYHNLIAADLTGTLPIDDASYGALVCAGTFTHGHVGPVCLPELMRVARPGALVVLSINAEFFDTAGFGSAFARLVADGKIEPLRFHHIRLYAENADHDHAEDTGLLAIFRRL